jgi:recombination protein RecT
MPTIRRARAAAGLVRRRPPILGFAQSPIGARPANSFRTSVLADGRTAELAPADARHSTGTRCKVVIHTPGHAANHLCLVMLEDGLLFSGDHILNGSTTVVDPPDGDMTAYLDSLDRCPRPASPDGIEFILPAHGHVLGQAAQAIAPSSRRTASSARPRSCG